ncbi:MAG: hypothetical protein RIC55_04815 [Pirellulaceae bacterium]
MRCEPVRPALQTSIAAWCVGVALLIATAAARAEPRVYLEIVTTPTFPIEGSQELARKLGEAGADNLRIRQAKEDVRPSIEKEGTDASPIYFVTGVVDSSMRLHLPGATLNARSPSSVRGWIEQIKAGGADGPSAGPGAFGLSGAELLAVHEKLATAVGFSTKDRDASDTAGAIVRSLPLKVLVDDSARAALAGDETVIEEMQLVSRGAALAAILRPLGLVFVPQKSRTGEVTLVIADSRKVEQSWPVGWPSEKAERDTLPALFEFQPVNVNNVPLSEAVTALEGLLKTPFFYDHNSLARHGIEPTEVKVSHPEGRTYFKKVIDRLLSQAKMKAELRVDEAGHPLFWLTTIRP